MLSYLDLTTTAPSFNLALEQYVFDSLPKDRNYFMLWQNDKAVIIGKHQNTLAEINESYVRSHGISVVRRLSGGGAVYHDLGNLNFTFIADAFDTEHLNFRLFCLPVVRTLESIGVHAKISGRNDITIDGKKFSGNSEYMKNGRVMHHGTILFSSDLDAVKNALKPKEGITQAKGVQSKRSRITNVCDHLKQDISLSDFRALLLQNVLSEMPGTPYRLTEHDIAAIETLKKERYDTWDWNYGRSPGYTSIKRMRFDGCGLVEVCLSVKDGVIVDIAFKGDFFSTRDPEELAARFIGHKTEHAQYVHALSDIDVSRYFRGLTREQLLRLLI